MKARRTPGTRNTPRKGLGAARRSGSLKICYGLFVMRGLSCRTLAGFLCSEMLLPRGRFFPPLPPSRQLRPEPNETRADYRDAIVYRRRFYWLKIAARRPRPRCFVSQRVRPTNTRHFGRFLATSSFNAFIDSMRKRRRKYPSRGNRTLVSNFRRRTAPNSTERVTFSD